MSTAGKVLIVLVLLLLPIWIILAAGVAQLDTEWTQAVIKLEKQVATLEDQVVDNERQARELKDQIALEQGKSESEQTVLRARLTEVERAKAEHVEIQTAVTNELETVHAEVKYADTAKEQRIKELQEETRLKTEVENVVRKLKGENEQLLAQLLALREEFKKLLESNRKIVDGLRKADNPGTPARRTSLVP